MLKPFFVGMKNGGDMRTHKSNVDQVVWTPIKNAATRVAALLSGEVDLLTDMPVQDLERIRSHEKLQVMMNPTNPDDFLRSGCEI